MQALLDAISSKFTGSTLWDTVGGRIFQGYVDLGTGTPYLAYSIVTAVPDRTFSERYTDAIIQFDLFSLRSAGATEITTMYANLISLFDECALTITGYALIWMRESNLVTLIEDTSIAQDGSEIMNHFAVDFDIRISLN